MKARRPRSTGSKYSGEKKNYSRPSGGYRKREDGDGFSSGDKKERPSGRPFKKTGTSGGRFSKGPDREGYRGRSEGTRDRKPRPDASDRPGQKRTFKKSPWERKPDSGSGKKKFGDKSSSGRFDRDKKPFGRTGERGERKSFDRPARGERPERSSGGGRFERGSGPERPSGERRPSERSSGESRPYRSDKPSYSDRPKRDFGSGDERRAGRSSGGFRREDRGRGEGERPERPWNRKESHEFYGDKKKFSKPRPATESSEDDGSTRLNKYISNAGICSRREADELIKAGVVSVNGEVVTEMGFKVKPGDEVRYNNETLRSEKMVYVLLNKPKDFISTSDDPENRKTVMSLVANACKERIYPVGRLDRNTTGLLLFTNDGELARRLTHPSFEVQKIYQVDLDKNLKSGDMDKIAEGMELEDGYIKPDAINYVGSGSDKSIVGIELHSGKNRIVRRIFEQLEYAVKKLDRVYFAGLSKKDLPRGRWRFLTEMEVASLKMLTGDKKFKGLTPKPNFSAVD